MGPLEKIHMQNLLDPAILFFLLGVLAGAIKSNLEIPPAISRFLSLYLLMALGLKGGFALRTHSQCGHQLGSGHGACHLHPFDGVLVPKAFCYRL
jgi:hypothetical protein